MRHPSTPGLPLLSAIIVGVAAPGLAQTSPAFLTPPPEIVEILDAAPIPSAVVSPNGATVAMLHRRSMPPLAELAQPMLGLAGYRINPRTNGPHATSQRPGHRITVTRVADGTEQAFDAPPETSLSGPEYSPDGSRLLFLLTRYNGIEAWMMEVETGQARPLTDASVNAVWNDPCDWLDENATVVCLVKRSARGSPPSTPDVPTGPNVQQHDGGAAPIRTYQDLLRNPHDEALFEYYFESQIATIELATGRRTPVGQPGLFQQVSASPNGQYFLTVEVEQPYSWLVPARSFARDVTVRNRSGEVVAGIARLPLADAVPIGGVPTGPRGFNWNPTLPDTLVWVEALDGGDPGRDASPRDRVLTQSAPFTGEASELATTEFRFAGLRWTEDGTALLTESDRPSRRTRTWLLSDNAAPRPLWDRSSQDRYADPGTPLARARPGSSVLRQSGRSIWLAGAGASPDGDRPFYDRLDLDSLETSRLFRSAEDVYESVVAQLDEQTFLTRRESSTEPPNYVVRSLEGDTRALTTFPDPAPQLTGVTTQLVTYERADGVQLSGTLYLPPGHIEGQPLPMVMWAYPREFVDPRVAGQVSGSNHRFTTIRGASHLLLLTQGFAIFDGPTMPIIGPGETANDTYVEQLVASAEAAVDAVVSLGVTTRGQIGIGGHSYGAFMTANLLAHSDLFQTGIARSGAYNRSLTPFGFQNERRTFWEATDIYAAMSPFFHADKINEPILLIHGENDNNSGTFPIQSARMYMALKGHGVQVRYVTLPHESHGYAARESVLHTVAEMLRWATTHLTESDDSDTGP